MEIADVDGQVYIWDRKQYDNEEAIDLKDLGVFYGINKIEDVGWFADEDISYFLDLRNKIQSNRFAYHQCNIDVDQYSEDYITPSHLKKSLQKEKEWLLGTFLQCVSEKPYFHRLVRFLKEQKIPNVIKHMNYSIQTSEGEKQVDLSYAANFRFKANPGSYNLLNSTSEYRKTLVPQDENSFIYAADYKQFEFRTFLDIHPELEYDFETKNIYEQVAKDVNLDLEDAKLQIIAYLYGKKNEKLDKFLKRDIILNMVTCSGEFFERRGLCAILNTSKPKHVRLHTIIQTLSQWRLLSRMKALFELLKDKKSKFLYPLHDELVFSINKDEINLIKEIRQALEDGVYKISEYIGHNLYEVRKLK